jgi:hypothetical protein
MHVSSIHAYLHHKWRKHYFYSTGVAGSLFAKSHNFLFALRVLRDQFWLFASHTVIIFYSFLRDLLELLSWPFLHLHVSRPPMPCHWASTYFAHLARVTPSTSFCLPWGRITMRRCRCILRRLTTLASDCPNQPVVDLDIPSSLIA